MQAQIIADHARRLDLDESTHHTRSHDSSTTTKLPMLIGEPQRDTAHAERTMKLRN
jgi:hypothetical protein